MSNGAYAGLRLARCAGPPGPHDSDDGTTETPPSGERKDDEMTDDEHKAALAEAEAKARAEGATAANARYATVMASEHYAGREALAQTLLGNDKLTAEEIVTSLAAAEPKPAAAALSEAQILAAAEEGGRKEMQAALNDGDNSGLDASGGKGPDKAAASASVWDTAIASVFPSNKAK